ncbi:MAG: hypothetical protein H0X67_24285 [Acidobacteria bacterium]|nr:hypothetical protein [Acidobacteriota bacterium]
MTRAIAAVLGVLLLAATLSAQRPTDVVKWTATAARAEVKAGSIVSIEATADVQPGWYLYGLAQPKGGPIPLNFAGAKGKLFQVQPRGITGPEPVSKDDPVFDLETKMHAGRTVFTVPVLVARGVTAGSHTIPIEITFQACGEGICLRPYTQTVQVGISVR